MPRPQRVSLEAIGRELNISTSSVSRALRDDPLIHPETRARVKSMATRLGYQGRSRRGPRKGGQTRSVRAILAANSLTDIKSYFNMMSYIQGMTSAAEAAKLPLNVHAIPPDAELKNGSLPAVLDMAKNDALIVVGTHEPSFVAKLAKSFPVVSLVRTYPEIDHDLISTDNVSGMFQIVTKLAKLGHRKLAWVSEEDDVYYSHARRAGFLEGCVSSGLDITKQEILSGIYKGRDISRPERILQALKKGVTAFVGSSDHSAFQVWRLLTSHGVKIPRDASVTGFDSIRGPDHPQDIRLTTYDPRFVEIGRAAVRVVLWRMENASAAPLQVTVSGRLVEGETTAPPPRGS